MVSCILFGLLFWVHDQNTQTKAVKKHLYTRKIYYSVDFLPCVSANPLPYNTARSTTSKPDMSTRFNRKPAVGPRSNSINMLPQWALNLNPRYDKPRLYVSVNLLVGVYGRHLARLRRRAYAPTRNTASHEKINFLYFPIWVRGPLGGPLGLRSSANLFSASFALFVL